MKIKYSVLLLFFGLCLSAPARAQTSATLVITTDILCNWKFDGQPMGLLMTDDSKALPVSPGEHLIEAVTTDGMATVRNKVKIDQAEKKVDIKLKSRHDRQLEMQRAETAGKQAEAALNPTWTDPATSLMWTRKDNGSDLNWNEARTYCSNLKLAGYSDWRLPTVEELQSIYDSGVSSRKLFDNGVTYNVHVKGNLNLTGWDWSDSQGNVSSEAWLFNFGNEKPRNSFPRGFSYSSRALCVRRSEE